MSWIPNSIYQSNRAKNEIAAAKANARLAERGGENEAAQIREKARRLAGENRAVAGASGVDISGSFLDALADNDISAELDAQTALWNRKMEVENYRATARDLQARRKAEQMGGVFDSAAGALQGLLNR
jgi:hypothetical protein